MKKNISIKNKIEAAALLKIAPFRKEIRKTEPHKHSSYFEIIYLQKGKGFHTIDHTSFSIKPPTLFFVRKEQVHHWDIADVPEGYVLILKKGFVEKSLDGGLKNLLSKLSGFNCIHLKEIQGIDTLFKLLITEKNFIVLEGLLKALFAKTLDAAKPLPVQTNKTDDTIVSFRELLNQTSDLHNSVAHYAEKLHTTPQNLNAICRKTLNQSAAEVIAEHIISEAKRQLIYTDNSVSEIAYSLNFNDTSHFVKYFKRHTGVTPFLFRNT
ncbi:MULTISPECIES: helix-turn-helix domain-containing protein [Weeksellaceae]|uniref:Helix-turn-helix domain-containing protein n=1 Tax=Chryseobacterium nakagawai TaxID=1241982 RepID=A0AAD0YMY6_CHRNA|nr:MULTISPECIES: helix-turn-helix transcriptional regulator [Weeksellaceae]AZA92827.1 helix-turn-helix domain-containing protein [Chryseobacterium nakagawai]MDX8576883.1 helix-turn-helix transcriptional regulator [Elizabethkingia sp. HX WYD]VEH19438.1 transcriptional activator RhaS [Chryseobacterium nakagawai]